MPTCVIKHCKNYTQKPKKGVTFHRLPTDPILLREWMMIIRKNRRDNYWLPSKFCVVCSTHFKRKDMFYNRRGRRLVRRRGKPTLNLVSTSYDSDSSDGSSEESSDDFIDCDFDEIVGHNEDVAFDKDSLLEADSTSSEAVETDDSINFAATNFFKTELRRILVRKTTTHDRLKTLRLRLVRLESRNRTVEIILKKLTDRSPVTFDDRVMRQLFQIISKHTCGRQNIHYPAALRKFCLTLSLYSPRSYLYVRRCFSNCLPHPKTLEVWFNRGVAYGKFPRRPAPRHVQGDSSYYESD